MVNRWITYLNALELITILVVKCSYTLSLSLRFHSSKDIPSRQSGQCLKKITSIDRAWQVSGINKVYETWTTTQLPAWWSIVIHTNTVVCLCVFICLCVCMHICNYVVYKCNTFKIRTFTVSAMFLFFILIFLVLAS